MPERAIRFTLTWGLGGMALILFLLLAGSGTLLLFAYRPVPDQAHASVLELVQDVSAGRFVRNIHYFSANLLMIVSFLHLLRVVFTGGIGGKRRMNWWIGLALWAGILLSAFSGYLLPWDQRAYWAVTISGNMLSYAPLFGEALQQAVIGGTEPGRATLLRFYALHTTVLPLTLVAFMAWHFWRVRKADGVVLLRTPDEQIESPPVRVPTIPHLVVKEAAVAIALTALVFMLAALFDAPLGPEADPEQSMNPVKAPWYFLGIQELLLHMHPVLAAHVLPAAAIVGLCLLPLWCGPEGVWFGSRRERRQARVALLTGMIATPALIVISEFVSAPAAWPPWASSILLPLALPGLIIAMFLWSLRRAHQATRAEMIRTLTILLVVVYLMLTVTGIWFRGENMALVAPWSGGAL